MGVYYLYTMTHPKYDHVLVGGGLSGSLALIELLRTTPSPISIAVLEENPHRLFKGKAYSAEVSAQVLNVPAERMSLYWDQSSHFVRWLEAEGHPYGPHDFVPRTVYGRYITATVHEALNQHAQHSVRFVFQKLEHLSKEGAAFRLQVAQGSLWAQNVWIATGNFSPADVATDPIVLNHPNYWSDPWRGAGLALVPAADSVLLVGTGLTMVDQVLALEAQGHTGPIYAVSRRGMYPLSHGPAPAYNWFAPYSGQVWSPVELSRLVRRAVVQAEADGGTWISVVNDLREFTPGIWAQWSAAERRQFLRHLRPYWEVHRHRLPAASLERLESLEQSGQLKRNAGRIRTISTDGSTFQVQWVVRGTAEHVEKLDVQWVINCTGPQSFGKKLKEPWIDSAVLDGLLESDPLALGIQPGRRQDPGLHLIGPPRKGMDWESTALHEIRARVKQEVHALRSV